MKNLKILLCSLIISVFSYGFEAPQIYKNKEMKIEQTKPKDFTDSQHEIAHTIKALGHPARVAIIEYLLSVDTCICGDIVDVLPLAQPTVSRHLKELKNAKLITFIKESKR